MKKNIKLFRSYISPYSIWNVCKLLLKSNSGNTYIGEGPEVKAFEKEFGLKFNHDNVCALNSGTSSLELAYELAGVGDGDEVITPVLTCTATNLPLLHKRAKIIFADIDKDLNISVEDVKSKITTKTKAIVFVHFGGNNRGLKELLEVAKENDIALIEDAAHAIGSDFWGKGDFTCLSFQAIKTLTTGDGGALICKDSDFDKKARRLRWFGYDRELKQQTGDTDLTEAGYKYHMTDIAATIGRGNLLSIDKTLKKQSLLIEEYRKEGIEAHSWFARVYTENRDGLQTFLKEKGIVTGVHHYRNDKYTVFGGRQPFSVMDELEDKYLLLPLHRFMDVNDVRYIAEQIRKFENNNVK